MTDSQRTPKQLSFWTWVAVGITAAAILFACAALFLAATSPNI